jgi:hypothetical protein
MPVNTMNLLQGPGTLYRAAFGAVEPTTVTAAPGAGWVDLGATNDGLTLTIEMEISELIVDQIIDVADARVVGRKIKLATSLAESTLDNFALVQNEAAPAAAAAGQRSYEPKTGIDGFVPAYGSLLFDGVAPGGKRRRVLVRRTLSIEGTETAYKKDEMTLLPVTWQGFYVSDSVKPFRIVDEVAV